MLSTRLATRVVIGLAAGLALLAPAARAHFLELIPSADVLPEGGEVRLDLRFTHPFDGGPVMEMAAPARFGMWRGGAAVDLIGRLQPAPVDGATTWSASVDLSEPGPALFYVEPQPYWEPAEGKFIVHFTKVLVDSFATGEGWDDLIGLPVEIRPLTRPTGLWVGNVFQGVVLKDGAPVPDAEVEVEFINDGTVTAPNDAFVTQVIRADAMGTFTYAMPRAGWWGFAALLEGDAPMTSPEGTAVPVEEGALIWVRAQDMTAD